MSDGCSEVENGTYWGDKRPRPQKPPQKDWAMLFWTGLGLILILVMFVLWF